MSETICQKQVVPVLKDPDEIFVGTCNNTAGGSQTVKPPQPITLQVRNPEGNEFLPSSVALVSETPPPDTNFPD